MGRVRVTPCVSGHGYAWVQVRVWDCRTRATLYPYPWCYGYHMTWLININNHHNNNNNVLNNNNNGLNNNDGLNNNNNGLNNNNNGLNDDDNGLNNNDPLPRSQRETEGVSLIVVWYHPPPSHQERDGGGFSRYLWHHPLPRLKSDTEGFLLVSGFCRWGGTLHVAPTARSGIGRFALGNNDYHHPLSLANASWG
jgi:hypothetical protein